MRLFNFKKHNKMQKKGRRIAGFTMAEVLIVVAILGILAAIAAPAAATIQRNMRQTELDSKAEIIYTAAQNRISKMKAGGSDDILQYKSASDSNLVDIVPLNDDGNPYPWDYDETSETAPDTDTLEFCYFTSDNLSSKGSAATAVMITGLIEEELVGNHWVVEYNPKAGTVYSVFYSEVMEIDSLYYDSTDEDGNRYCNHYRMKSYRLSKDAQIGYYSGGTTSSSKVTTIEPTITVTNAEKLTCDITCTVPNTLSDNLVFFVTLTDNEGHSYSKYYTLNGVNGKSDGYPISNPTSPSQATENKRYGYLKRPFLNKYVLQLTLDDLSSEDTRFYNLYGYNSGHDESNGNQCLTAGTDLTIAVTVSTYPENYMISTYNPDPVTTNSLYAYNKTSAEANVAANGHNTQALIQYGRHLQNLEYSALQNENIVNAYQISNIDFATNTNSSSTTDDVNYWGIVYPMRNFTPIDNAHLQSYDGLYDNKNTTIYGLKVAGFSTNGGLFDKIYDGQEISNITLIGTTVSGTNVGAVAGECSAGNGTAKISNCQVYLDSNRDLQGKIYKDAWLDGNIVGGLVGRLSSGTLNITDSFASTVIGHFTSESDAATATGGLIGQVANGASVEMQTSYAGSYLFGKEIGGLIGPSAGTVTINNCYCAGFAGLADNTSGAGLAMQSQPGLTMTNSYTVLAKLIDDSANNVLYYALAPSGNANNTYYATPNYSVDEEMGTDLTTLTDVEFFEALNTNSVFQRETSDTTAYDLMEGMSLGSYDYPRLTVHPHYGDWEATFQNGSLVYYERYRYSYKVTDASGNISDVEYTGNSYTDSEGNTHVLNTYGFAGDGKGNTLVDVDSIKMKINGTEQEVSVTVVGDGYGIVYDSSDSTNIPEEVTYATFASDGGSWSEKNNETLNKSDIHYNSTDTDGVIYYIYPFSAVACNPTIDSTDFYMFADIKNDVEEGFYYFNPYFAKTVKSETTIPSISMPKPSTVYVRTPRHLYALSNYYKKYKDSTASATFRQEQNLSYSKYDWAYANMTSTVTQQEPIGTGSVHFAAKYDGENHQINNISIVSSSSYYVGLFAYNDGTISDLVLSADYSKNNSYFLQRKGNVRANESAYFGTICGYNAGTVSNVASDGYYVAGTNGTIFAYSSSKLRIGGFAGGNSGTIQRCTSDTATLRVSPNYANCWLGGFVGTNKGTIRSCYDLGHIEVVQAKGGSISIAGFAADNNGAIYSCYCATALTGSGSTTSAYAFAPKSGSISGSYYLNNGSYIFLDHMYSYEFDPDVSAGTSMTYEEMEEKGEASKAVNSYDFSGNLMEKDYPFVAVVKKDNNLEHYGNWINDAKLGVTGIFYWEHEEMGTNNGYHFSYLGYDADSGAYVAGSTLCTAHDDGGVVTEYGYGYYVVDGNQSRITQNAVADITHGNGVNDSAQASLQDQMFGYAFYPYTTPDPFVTANYNSFSVNDDYIWLSNTSVNGTWTIKYNTGTSGVKTLTFTLSPFLGNSMSVTGGPDIKGDDLMRKNYDTTIGTTEDNVYEIRSYPQLQYLNWNISSKTALSDEGYVDTEESKTPYIYIYVKKNQTQPKYFYRQSHDLEDSGAILYGGDYEKRTPMVALGQAGVKFQNSYDGQEYQIKNLYVYSKGQFVGLFGEVGTGSVIKNVIMYAESAKGLIVNTYAGTQSSHDKNGVYEPAVGALVGMVWLDAGESVTISNCSAAGYTVRYIGNSPSKRYISVGGLIGSYFSISGCSITNCSAVNNIEALKLGSESNTSKAVREQIGGLIGTSSNVTIKNCYTGGTVTPSGVRSNYFLGGIVGNSKGNDGGDSTESSYGGTSIDNCYTYTKVVKSSDGKEYPVQWNASSNASYTFYYGYAGYTNIYTTRQGTSCTYEQFSNGTLLNNLVSRDGEAGWSAVTTTEAGATVHGKYSFPAGDVALAGKDYPFPTIIKQRDLIFGTTTEPTINVHYGSWPLNVYWAEARATLDIFDNMTDDGYAYKQFTLVNNSGTDYGTLTRDSFEVTSDNTEEIIAEVTDVAKDGYNYVITVKALNEGNATIAYNVYDFSLDVTANLNISVSPTSLEIAKGGTYTTALTFSVVSDNGTDYSKKDTATGKEAALGTPWYVVAVPGDYLTLTPVTGNPNVWRVTRVGYEKGDTGLVVGGAYYYYYNDKQLTYMTQLTVTYPVYDVAVVLNPNGGTWTLSDSTTTADPLIATKQYNSSETLATVCVNAINGAEIGRSDEIIDGTTHHYTFAGWAINGSTDTYNALSAETIAALVETDAYFENEVLNIYALWDDEELTSVTISFNPNGGNWGNNDTSSKVSGTNQYTTVSTDTLETIYNNVVGSDSTLAYEGNIFGGWKLKNAEVIFSTSGDAGKITLANWLTVNQISRTNIELEAQWIEQNTGENEGGS